jgi:phosphoribosylamine-glycine ligase
VTVTDDIHTARDAVRAALRTDQDTVVIEDYLDGPEVSLFAITDGETVLPLVPAQDFKRIGDGTAAQHRRDGRLHPLALAARRLRRRGDADGARADGPEMAARAGRRSPGCCTAGSR